MRSRTQGFTLIELMIVMVIVGVLAAAAIPILGSQQLRAKRAEGSTNVKAIAKLTLAYFGEVGTFPSIGGTWPGGGAPPPAKTTTPWDAAARTTFAPIGFSAEGAVRYVYDIDADVECACNSCFTVAAYSNLDGDGTVGGVGYFHRDKAGLECTTTVFGWSAPLNSGGVPQYEIPAPWPQIAGGADDY